MIGCKCGEGCGTIVPECCGKDIYECETLTSQGHTVCLVNQGCQTPDLTSTHRIGTVDDCIRCIDCEVGVWNARKVRCSASV